MFRAIVFFGLITSAFASSKTDEGGAAPPAIPAGGSIVCPPNQRKTSDEAQHGREEGTEFWPPFFGYRLKVTDTLIAFFTLGLFIATFLLWRATRNLVSDAEDTSKRQLRAYVGVERMELRCAGFSDPNYKPAELSPGYIFKDVISVTFKNFGLTPAYDVQIWVNWVPMPYPQRLPDAFPYPDYGVTGFDVPAPTRTRHILHKDQSHTSIIAIPDLRPFIATRRQETMLYIYGHIDYRDIYGRRCKATFCQSWEPWSSVGVEFVPYQEHNDETEA